MSKVKVLPVRDGKLVRIDRFPSFSRTGSVKGMKKLFYGENALLVRCGSWVYNVTAEPWIYHRAH